MSISTVFPQESPLPTGLVDDEDGENDEKGNFAEPMPTTVRPGSENRSRITITVMPSSEPHIDMIIDQTKSWKLLSTKKQKKTSSTKWW